MEQPPALSPQVSQASPTPKKGLPALAWVGIGCGGLVLIAAIVLGILIKVGMGKLKEFVDNPEKAAAEMIVKMNPDLKKISQDDVAGEMTIETKDGERVTISYKDLAEGRITVKDKDGNETRIGSADLSQIPAWVPKAPGLSDGISSFHSEQSDKISGQFSGKSPESLESLKAFYEEQASQLGLSNKSSSSLSSGDSSTLTLNYSGGGRELAVILTGRQEPGILVNTSYTEEK